MIILYIIEDILEMAILAVFVAAIVLVIAY